MTKVILSTFAGRFDRMHILLRYAEAALQSGAITEVHLWDFCRKDSDRQTLDAKYPIAFTPGDGCGYGAMQYHIYDRRFRVKTSGDAIITFGEYKLILSQSGINTLYRNNQYVKTFHGIAIGTDLRLTRNGRKVLFTCGGVSHVLKDVDKKTVVQLGSTEDALWDFGSPWKVMKVHPSKHNRHFSEYYRHYYMFHADTYSDTVLLKADDDIVYMELDQLPTFIESCRNSLATANVINNAFQLYKGDFMDQHGYELNDHGSYHELYHDGKVCERLHDDFLKNMNQVDRVGLDKLPIRQQFSINFIGMSSDIFVHFKHIVDEEAYNDECFISIELPTLCGQAVTVVKPFVVSHLSFYTQEHAMDSQRLIQEYSQLLYKI